MGLSSTGDLYFKVVATLRVAMGLAFIPCGDAFLYDAPALWTAIRPRLPKMTCIAFRIALNCVTGKKQSPFNRVTLDSRHRWRVISASLGEDTAYRDQVQRLLYTLYLRIVA